MENQDDHQGPIRAGHQKVAVVEATNQQPESVILTLQQDWTRETSGSRGTRIADQIAQDLEERFPENTVTEKEGDHQEEMSVDKLKSWMFSRTVMLKIMNQTFDLLETTQSCLGTNAILQNPNQDISYHCTLLEK